LTWPLLLAWERAGTGDREVLENLIQEWRPENFVAVNTLLAKYGTFAPSVEVIERYLEQARRALRVLPASPGRTGLLGLADFLAQQTGVLAV
jgi:octaprenyl-diphosphate synthase